MAYNRYEINKQSSGESILAKGKRVLLPPLPLCYYPNRKTITLYGGSFTQTKSKYRSCFKGALARLRRERVVLHIGL